MQHSRLGLGLLAALLAALLPVASPAAPVLNDIDLSTIDVRDAIECRLDAPVYTRFALALNGEEKLAAKRGWTPVTSANFLLAEYALPAPILVAGGYSTRRIAFTASGVVAILDLADPAVVARPAQIDNAMAVKGPGEGQATFRKFLGERVLRDVTDPADGDHFRARTIIARSISNVATHPGKTLYGCAYRIALLDKEGNPL